jgi:hypothetical protein
MKPETKPTEAEVFIEDIRKVINRWGVYCLDGPAKDTWCQHVEGHRIETETDERTARTIAHLFRSRSEHVLPGGYHYEERELPR